MWNIIAGLVGKVVTGYQTRKATESAAKAAWESSVGRSMDNGWKDEFVTIVIMWPVVQLFVGNLIAALTDDTRVILANQQSLQELGLLMETPYGKLMMVVALAAVGIKGLKVLK